MPNLKIGGILKFKNWREFQI